MNKECVLILSGGLDSTTLLHLLKDEGYKVHVLSFSYGQRHSKELSFAKSWADKMGESWQLIDLSFMKHIASNSALTSNAIALPEEHYSHENQKITVVPNRNMVMLSIAVAHAENLGIKEVFYGAQAGDDAHYPDCRMSFVEAVSEASKLGTYSEVQIKAPFAKKSKSEVVELGINLKVDFKQTWSCYAGTHKPCGKCSTCQARLEAFNQAGMIDPVEYMG